MDPHHAMTTDLMPEPMVRKLGEIDARYRELDALIADPGLFNDPDAARGKLKEHTRLKPMVEGWREFQKLTGQVAEAQGLLGDGADPELKELAQAELPDLQARVAKQVEHLRELFVTSDAESESDCIVEVNAGVGGDEGALFAGDLARMYMRYAELKGWRAELIDQAEGKAGGFKKISFTIEGTGVYRRLRFESGGHRVQRVPETETQGRIHTSMATVVVLPQVEEVDVTIKESDVRKDKFSAGGPGGQHVNKTESAVRLTHIPTGLVVQCQDEKSQIKNFAKAWKVLRARYADFLKEQVEKERGATRQSLRGRGNRNERIRTYNFPQDRCTDHRIGVTVHNLPKLLAGELDPLIDALVAHDKEESLKAL
jgi:peptide chain release factor 1